MGLGTRSRLRPLARAVRYKAGQQVEKLRPIKRRDEIHAYWTAPDEDNRPEGYVSPEGGSSRSAYVVGLAEPYLSADSRVLEVGCNVGRNLNEFWQTGHKDVSGIEISPGAIAMLRDTYPEMAATATLHEGNAEDILPTLPSNGYDVVFTLAVLVHIHPDSASVVFPGIARVAKNALVLVEDERHRSWRHFTRNYREVFEPLGWQQVHEEACGPLNIGLPDDYVARVFIPTS